MFIKYIDMGKNYIDVKFQNSTCSTSSIAIIRSRFLQSGGVECVFEVVQVEFKGMENRQQL